MSVDSEHRLPAVVPTPTTVSPVRGALRLVAAVGLAVLVALVLWWLVPLDEPRRIDVVGYPSYNAFDFRRMFLGYRLFVWLVPLVAATTYWLLGRTSRFGDVRRADPGIAVPMTDTPATGHSSPGSPLTRVLSLLPATGVVAVAASSTSQDPGTRLTTGGLLVALAYAATVAAVAAGLGRRRPTVAGMDDAWATVSAVSAAVAAMFGLFWFTQHTVAVSGSGTVDWPWLPLWGAIPAICLALGWIALRRRSERPSRETAQRVNRVLVGSAAVVLMTARLPGSLGGIDQFDGMMSVTGADLWLRGDFPWRDFVFIHGFFEDALRSAVGFGLFEHTKWGADAATASLWRPLSWVGVYLLGGWAARSGWLGWLGALALVLLASSQFDIPSRWVAAAFVFVLFGHAVRRRRRGWTYAMTGALFVEAVLVPEASFQVLAIAPVLLLVDLVHRTPGTRWWRSLDLTRDFVVAGLACTSAWALYLALNGALGGFVRYYLIFGPGHVASGARPFGNLATHQVVVVYLLSATLAAASVGLLAWRLLARRPMSVRHWVTLACALFAALYSEKGLGRADTGHLWQSVSMTLPLAVVVLVSGLDGLQVRLRTRDRRSTGSALRAHPLAVAAGALTVLVSCLIVVQQAWVAPSHNKARVGDTSTRLLGYTTDKAVAWDILDDLTTVVDSLAGKDGSVFDFTNTPGYFYYLMQRPSPTTFYHVSMAVPEFSQELVIDELREKRPAVVAFDSKDIGLTNWDMISNQVRHYALAQYLLDGWRPVARSHEALFLLRNDLTPSLPDPADLHEPLETTDLYDANRGCDWGQAANYLESAPAGGSVTLTVGSPRLTRYWETSGWAYDGTAGTRVERVLVAVGDEVVQTLQAAHPRLDLAAKFKAPDKASSSFEGWGTTSLPGRLTLYAELADGAAHPLARARRDQPPGLRLGATTIRTSPVRATGTTILRSRLATVSTVKVPASVDPSSYELATFRAAGRIGRAQVLLATSSTGSSDRDSAISFRTRPWTGASTRVRVGSCLQWHGYTRGGLQLVQSRGGPITEIRLSDVS